MTLLLTTLLAAAALGYGCVAWHGTVVCVFIAALGATGSAVLLAMLRELWILHQLRDM